MGKIYKVNFSKQLKLDTNEIHQQGSKFQPINHAFALFTNLIQQKFDRAQLQEILGDRFKTAWKREKTSALIPSQVIEAFSGGAHNLKTLQMVSHRKTAWMKELRNHGPQLPQIRKHVLRHASQVIMFILIRNSWVSWVQGYWSNAWCCPQKRVEGGHFRFNTKVLNKH